MIFCELAFAEEGLIRVGRTRSGYEITELYCIHPALMIY